MTIAKWNRRLSHNLIEVIESHAFSGLHNLVDMFVSLFHDSHLFSFFERNKLRIIEEGAFNDLTDLKNM